VLQFLHNRLWIGYQVETQFEPISCSTDVRMSVFSVYIGTAGDSSSLPTSNRNQQVCSERRNQSQWVPHTGRHNN